MSSHDTDTPASLPKAVASYAAARVELASIEAGEFATFAKKSGARFAAAALSLLLGYLVLLIGISFILGNFIDRWTQDTALQQFGGAGLAAAAIGLLHITVGIILCLGKKSPPQEGFFSYTREELKRDKQWLQSNK